MARLLGPDPNTRTAWRIVAGTFKTAAGGTAVVYTDTAGSVLADIEYWDGTNTPAGAVAGSALTVDYQSQFPKFWFPNGVDVVYVSVDDGPLQEVHANLDPRIDEAVAAVATFDDRITNLEAGGTGDTLLVHKAGAETITGAKTFSGTITVPEPSDTAHAATRGYIDNGLVAEANVRAAHEAATTGVHGIVDTSALETMSGSTAKVAAHAGAADPHGDRAFATSADIVVTNAAAALAVIFGA